MKGWVLILGARQDIALPLARLYAAAGYNLYLADTQPELLNDGCQRLMREHGIEARVLSFDFLYFNGHEKFFHRLNPAPVGVVCLADFFGDHLLATRDMEEVSRIVQMNFVGPVSILNVVAEFFEKQNSGFIVGVSSVMGDGGCGDGYFYSSAKASFTVYLSGLRRRLSPSGVRVLTVKTGLNAANMPTGFPFSRRLAARPEEAARDIFRAQQKGRGVLYTPCRARLLMWPLIHLPERFFGFFAR